MSYPNEISWSWYALHSEVLAILTSPPIFDNQSLQVLQVVKRMVDGATLQNGQPREARSVPEFAWICLELELISQSIIVQHFGFYQKTKPGKIVMTIPMMNSWFQSKKDFNFTTFVQKPDSESIWTMILYSFFPAFCQVNKIRIEFCTVQSRFSDTFGLRKNCH